MNKGFTIIEMIVVIAIFLFVIGAGLGIFISIVQNQRKVLAEQQILSQISYIEEYMSKALRMAKTDGDGSCLGQPNAIYKLTRPYRACDDKDPQCGFFRGIKFINQTDNVCQEFFLDNVTDPAHPVLKELRDSNDDNDAVALTSDNLKINFMRFGINGTDGSEDIAPSPADGKQPRVTILLNFTAPIADDQPSRTIQTTVSRRNLNVNQ